MWHDIMCSTVALVQLTTILSPTLLGSASAVVSFTPAAVIPSVVVPTPPMFILVAVSVVVLLPTIA